MGYFQIYLYTPYANHVEFSSVIANSFLNQTGVKGYSYNLYFGGDELLSHITVRFNFENDDEGKKAIEKIIGELIDKKLVIAKGEWQPFEESLSVSRATEVATKCAFAFKNWMNSNIEEKKYFFGTPQNRIDFTSRFLAILLNQLGFKTVFEEYPLDDRIEAIKNCAKECSDQVKEDFNKPLDIVFMERVIHHFLNCIYIDTGIEPAIMGNIAYWELLGNLIEKKKNT